MLSLQALPAGAAELLVSAAVSLRESFVQIGREFEKRHPADKVIFNFGASGELAQQIQRGAPADVFASASFKEMNNLIGKGYLLDRSLRPFVKNRLVIIVPHGGRKISSIEELAQLNRITMGNPQTVPAGLYAAEALSKASIYDRLLSERKIVFAESVRQSMNYVEGANVDAGLVYSTDAKISRKATVSLLLPESASEPIVYPIAVVADSKHVELSRAFVDFVRSKVGQDVLIGKGFLPVDK